jgi:hypothetical protein
VFTWEDDEVSGFDINAAFDRAQGKEPGNYSRMTLEQFQGM